jgi:ribonuclease HI
MLTNSGQLQLRGSSFSHNAALGPGSYGGAVLVRSSSGSSGVEVVGCSFTNNSAELTVSIYSTLITVCITSCFLSDDRVMSC